MNRGGASGYICIHTYICMCVYVYIIYLWTCKRLMLSVATITQLGGDAERPVIPSEFRWLKSLTVQ